MREAELKREVTASANWQVFYVAVLGLLLVVAVMYFLTQYVVGFAGAAPGPAATESSSPVVDTPSSSGGTELFDPGSAKAPAVFFS